MAQDTNGQSAAWGGRTSGNRGLLGESGQRQEGGAPGRGDAPEIREGEYGPRWGGLAAKWSPGKSPKELGRRGGGRHTHVNEGCIGVEVVGQRGDGARLAAVGPGVAHSTDAALRNGEPLPQRFRNGGC